MTDAKITWEGVVVSVQPRIRLHRSFDQRAHSYLGFVLGLRGTAGEEAGEFGVAIGHATQARHRLRVGDEVQGSSHPVRDPDAEIAQFYRTSGVRLLSRPDRRPPEGPPWLDIPPSLEVYRARGHRRLSARTYESSCRSCQWGCLMPVEMVVDQWNPTSVKHRTETFCYGPKSCPTYRPGPTRKVPGRRGMTYTEEDWVDEEDTAHRGLDE